MDIKNELKEALKIQRELKNYSPYRADCEKIMKDMLDAIKLANESKTCISYFSLFIYSKRKIKGEDKKITFSYQMRMYPQGGFSNIISFYDYRCWTPGEIMENFEDPDNGYTEFFSCKILKEGDSDFGIRFTLK